MTTFARVLERLLVALAVASCLDGAMGTMIQRHKLTEADFRGERFKDHPKDLQGNNDLLILTRPDVISEIHGQYLAAGADIIETNTFSSTSVAQADYALESLAYELNLEGARLARAACDEWTTQDAGSPALRRRLDRAGQPHAVDFARRSTIRRSARTTFDALRDAYEEQVRGLIDGGADILLLETIFDTLNAKAGIVAIENVFVEKGIRLPLMISFTITDKSGRTLSGQTLEAFYISVRHAQPFSIGINCALGARDMRPVSRRSRAHRRVLRQQLPERRAAQRVRPVRRAPGETGSPGPGLRRRAASSTSSAAAAGPRPITSRRLRRRWKASEPRPSGVRPRTRRCPSRELLRPGAAHHPSGLATSR